MLQCAISVCKFKSDVRDQPFCARTAPTGLDVEPLLQPELPERLMLDFRSFEVALKGSVCYGFYSMSEIDATLQ